MSPKDSDLTVHMKRVHKEQMWWISFSLLIRFNVHVTRWIIWA